MRVRERKRKREREKERELKREKERLDKSNDSTHIHPTDDGRVAHVHPNNFT